MTSSAPTNEGLSARLRESGGSFGERQARHLRQQAAHQDKLAEAARRDGDLYDEAACLAKAAEFRRQARRYEVAS